MLIATITQSLSLVLCTPSYTLRVYCYYLDYQGNVVSKVWGMPIKIDGKLYGTNQQGYVEVTVSKGTHTIEVLERTISGNHYYFAKWSDGNTNNPREVSVYDDTQLTVYVWRECLVDMRLEKYLQGSGIVYYAVYLGLEPIISWTDVNETTWVKWGSWIRVDASPYYLLAYWEVYVNDHFQRTVDNYGFTMKITGKTTIIGYTWRSLLVVARMYCGTEMKGVKIKYRVNSGEWREGTTPFHIWGLRLDDVVEFKVELPFSWRGIGFTEEDYYGFSWKSSGRTAELGKNPKVRVNWWGEPTIYAVFKQKGLYYPPPPPSVNHVTVYVKDYDTNKPIENAIVEVYSDYGDGDPSDDDADPLILRTDKNGKVTFGCGDISVRIVTHKDGYEPTNDPNKPSEWEGDISGDTTITLYLKGKRVKLVVVVKYLDYRGRVVSIVQDMPIKIDGKTYRTDRNGKVTLTIGIGKHDIEILRYTHWRGYNKYYFAKWSDGNTNNPRTFDITRDTTITAYVWREVKVVVDGDDELTVTPSKGTRWYKYYKTVTFEAKPHDRFDRWIITYEDGTKEGRTDNPLTKRITKGFKIYAKAKEDVELTIYTKMIDNYNNIIGSCPHKTLKIDGVEYKTDRNGVLKVRVKIGTHKIEITSPEYYTSYKRVLFVKWEDGSSNNPRTIKIDRDTTITAYLRLQYKVTITSDDGLTTNPKDTHWYNYKYMLRVSASPSDKFDYWSIKENPNGDSWTSKDNPLNIRIEDSYSIHAHKKKEVTVTIYTRLLDYQGNDVGVCPYKDIFIDGVKHETDKDGKLVITLTVGNHEFKVSSPGYYNNWKRVVFARWHDGNTDNPRTFNIQSDTTITAYLWLEYKVVITSDEDLETNPKNTNWYGYKYPLTVVASPRNLFEEWIITKRPSGESWTSRENPLRLVIDSGYEIHAKAKEQPIEVTLTIYTKYLDYQGKPSGVIPHKDIYIDGVRYETDENGVLSIKLTVGEHEIKVLSPGYYSDWERYTFARWDDGSTENPRRIVLNEDTVMTAYMWREHKVVIDCDVELSTIPSKGTYWYKYNYPLKVEAKPYDKFDYWRVTEMPNGKTWTSNDNPLRLTIDKGYKIYGEAKEIVTHTVNIEVRDYETNELIKYATVIVNGTEYNTGSSGILTLTLVEGYYTIVASKEGYKPTNDPNKPSEWSGEVNTDMTITLYLEKIKYQLRVTVRDYDTNQPIPRATVSVNGVNYVTDNNGVLVLDVAEGDYNIIASKEGYEETNDPNKPSRWSGHISGDTDITLWLKRLPVELTLTVIVRDYDTNTPIASATVRISGVGDYLTDGRGMVSVRLIEGWYAVTTFKDGYTETHDPNKPSRWSGYLNADTTITLWLKKIPPPPEDIDGRLDHRYVPIDFINEHRGIYVDKIYIAVPRMVSTRLMFYNASTNRLLKSVDITDELLPYKEQKINYELYDVSNLWVSVTLSELGRYKVTMRVTYENANGETVTSEVRIGSITIYDIVDVNVELDPVWVFLSDKKTEDIVSVSVSVTLVPTYLTLSDIGGVSITKKVVEWNRVVHNTFKVKVGMDHVPGTLTVRAILRKHFTWKGKSTDLSRVGEELLRVFLVRFSEVFLETVKGDVPLTEIGSVVLPLEKIKVYANIHGDINSLTDEEKELIINNVTILFGYYKKGGFKVSTSFYTTSREVNCSDKVMNVGYSALIKYDPDVVGSSADIYVKLGDVIEDVYEGRVKIGSVAIAFHESSPELTKSTVTVYVKILSDSGTTLDIHEAYSVRIGVLRVQTSLPVKGVVSDVLDEVVVKDGEPYLVGVLEIPNDLPIQLSSLSLYYALGQQVIGFSKKPESKLVKPLKIPVIVTLKRVKKRVYIGLIEVLDPITNTAIYRNDFVIVLHKNVKSLYKAIMKRLKADYRFRAMIYELEQCRNNRLISLVIMINIAR